jgi:hypothetical protein
MLRMVSRRIPLLIALELLMAGREHWDTLNPEDRQRAGELLKKSKGDPRRLTPDERAQVRELARRLELGRLARAIAPIAWRGRRGRR